MTLYTHQGATRSGALGNTIIPMQVYFNSPSIQQSFATQDIPYLSICDLNSLRQVNKGCYRIYALAFNIMKVFTVHHFNDITSFCDIKARVSPKERLASWYRRVADIIIQRTPSVYKMNIHTLKRNSKEHDLIHFFNILKHVSNTYRQINNGQIKSFNITFNRRKRITVLLPTLRHLTPTLHEFKGVFHEATRNLVDNLSISRLHTLHLCFHRLTQTSAILIPGLLSSQTLQKLTLKGVFINMSEVTIGLPIHQLDDVKLINCKALNYHHWQSLGRHLAGVGSLSIVGSDGNSVYAMRPLLLDSKSIYLKEYRVFLRYTGNEKVCEVNAFDTTEITIQASVKQSLRVVKEYIRLICTQQVTRWLIEGKGIIFGVEAAKLFDRQHPRLSRLRSCRFVDANVSGALTSIATYISKLTSDFSEFYISDQTLRDKDISSLVKVVLPTLRDFGIGTSGFKNKKSLSVLADALMGVKTVRLKVMDAMQVVLAKLKKSKKIKTLDLSGSTFSRGIEKIPMSIPSSLLILSLKNCALKPPDMGNVKTITRAGVLVNVTGNMLNSVSSPRSSQKIIGLGEQKEYIPVKHKKGKKTKRQNKRGHRTKGRNR
ncbi:hypothetical protein N9N03_01615 [Chlamydiia bacterium]|nr:hypothetical protein [Chlamydiia bacterium]